MNSTLTDLRPITVSQRIEAMDVLRGFALLGILLMNMEAFVGPLLASLSGLDPQLTGADRLADAAIYILVQGKFYTLFSLLFGMGFAVMMQRAKASGTPFVGLYLRRNIALLGIGLMHALLIWSGDILVSYALMGFLLILLFRNTPTSRLPKWGVVLVLLPGIIGLFFGSMADLARLDPAASVAITKSLAGQQATVEALLEGQRIAYGQGSIAEAIGQRGRDLGFMTGFVMMFGWNILGMFLIGSWFVQSGAITRPEAFESLYRQLRWLALPAGLALVLTAFIIHPTVSFSEMSLKSGMVGLMNIAGSMLMCMGYMAWIIRGLQSNTMAPRLAFMAPAGRMALSNYLTQSIVCTFIFYGYGLGFFEQLPRAWQVPFAFALWGLQLAFSRWWFTHYAIGPVEYLWRWATYGKRPKFVS